MTERLTDVYVITMLLLFPLFFGFRGYSNITLSKYVLFLALTGLWLLSLLAAALFHRAKPAVLRPAHAAALAFAFVALLSWLCCDARAVSFLGAGRFDGLLSTLAYLLVFWGVAVFGRVKEIFLRAFAVSVTLCALVALLQLAGFNPLRLYPRDLDYYDSGIRYTGVFLGTIGNTNILDAILALAIPLFLAYYVCSGEGGFLPALLPVFFVFCKAGGDGLKLALLAALLAAPPLLLTSICRVRRFLRAGACLLLSASLSALWTPGKDAPLRFAFTPLPFVLLAGAALLAVLSCLPLPARFMPQGRSLRRFFSVVSAAAVIAGLAFLLLAPPQSGTLHELSQLLHGHAEDSFGSNRIRIWRACLALVRERPLLGQGPGMLADRIDILFSRFVPETGETLYASVDNAHNVYLAVLVNTGVLGLAAYLTTLALAAADAAQRLRKPLILPLILSLLSAAIHAFFGLGLCLSEPLFWLMLGLLCAGPRSETNA